MIVCRVLHKLHIFGTWFSTTWATNSSVTPCEWIVTQTLEWGNYISNSAPGTKHDLHIEGTGSFVIRKHYLIMQWWTNSCVSCYRQLLGQMESQQCHRMHVLKFSFLPKAEVQRAICFLTTMSRTSPSIQKGLWKTSMHLSLLRTQNLRNISPVVDFSFTSLKPMFLFITWPK